MDRIAELEKKMDALLEVRKSGKDADNLLDLKPNAKEKQINIRASEGIGETASDLIFERMGAQLLYTGSGNGTVDKIYRLADGRLAIIEAKGGSSILGSRKVKQGIYKGQRAQQGTKPYLEDIAMEMMNSGDPDKIEFGELILQEIDKDNLAYFHVKQEISIEGALKKPSIKEFDMRGNGFNARKAQ